MTAPPVHLLITGAAGQVGRALLAAAAGAPDIAAVAGLTRAELDLAGEPAPVRSAVVAAAERAREGQGKLVVINAAAYTAVDAAETDSDSARAGNVTGPAQLAAACAAADAHLVHLSTDYVFSGLVEPGPDGTLASAPGYDVDAPTEPRTVYGQTKLAGEHAVLAAAPGAVVVRTAWVWSGSGRTFATTMVGLAAGDGPVDVVADQWGSPTYAPDLAAALVELAVHPEPPGGVLHATGAGRTTWFGLAQEIFAVVGADLARVRAVDSGAVQRPAPRPAFSVLSGSAWAAAGLSPLPAWAAAVPRGLSRSLS